MLKNKKKPTIYGRLTIAIVSALIGTFVVPMAALIVADGLSFEQIGHYAIGGAAGFAVIGYLFPNPMGKVLFVLTLFQ